METVGKEGTEEVKVTSPHPTGIRSCAPAGVLLVRPSQGKTSSRNIHRPLYPSPSEISDPLPPKTQDVLIVGIHRPPKGESAGACDGGLKPRRLIVADVPALQSRHSIMGVGVFHKPRGVAPGGEDQVWVSSSLRQRHWEQNAQRADGRLRGVVAGGLARSLVIIQFHIDGVASGGHGGGNGKADLFFERRSRGDDRRGVDGVHHRGAGGAGHDLAAGVRGGTRGASLVRNRVADRQGRSGINWILAFGHRAVDRQIRRAGGVCHCQPRAAAVEEDASEAVGDSHTVAPKEWAIRLADESRKYPDALAH